MSRHLLRVGPFVNLALASIVAVTFAAAVVGTVFADNREGPSTTLASVVGGLVFVGVGALVVLRQPRNLIGWAFCIGALAIELENAGGGYLEHARVNDPESLRTAALVGLFADALWIPSLAFGIIFIFLLFPDGKPVTPGWRPLVWIATILGVVSVPLTVFAPGPLYYAEDIENPLGIDAAGGFIHFVQNGTFAAVMALVFVSIVSVGIRFRRSRGAERQQIKWFFFAAALLAVGTPLAIALQPLLIGTILFELLVAAIPVSVAIAILRYRLYDIDVIVNRTLVYAILTGLLALAYLGIVVVLQRIMAPVTSDSDVAVAGSTLAVAALFRPLRSRVQSFIDRRFYRRKYDAADTLAAFAGHLRDQVDLESLSTELVDVVATTMQPRHASLWLRGSETA